MGKGGLLHYHRFAEEGKGASPPLPLFRELRREGIALFFSPLCQT